MRIALRLAFVAILSLVGAPMRADPPTVPATVTVSVDPAVQFQPWQGWGTSLCWWANVVGGFPEPARSDYMTKAFDPVKGLGLNIVRYNIGGGENPAHLPPNPQLLAFRCNVPGYEPAAGTWNWNADANQRYVLRAAIAAGADQIEAFSNSPPYWMTVSGSVTGGIHGADNLQPTLDDTFAAYLAEVVAHFHDAWGITFRSVEPLNEPTNGWRLSGGNTHQEGCVVQRPHQSAVVKAMAVALVRRGIAQTTVSASDETSIVSALRTVPYYDADTLHGMTKINTHSYKGGDRTQLSDRTLSLGKDLWLSEYGDGDASGITTSRRILEDIRGLHPSAWVYWQVVDSAGGWGFLRNPLKSEDNTAYVVTQKFYVMGQYSKFIRPGYRMIAIASPDAITAFDARSRTLVIVATNSGETARSVSYDLSRFDHIDAAVKAYRTSATEALTELPPIHAEGKRFSISEPPRSVTTYVLNEAAYRKPMTFDPEKFYTLTSRRTGHPIQETAPMPVVSPTPGTALPPSSAAKIVGDNVGEETASAVDNRAQWRIVGQGDGTYTLVNRSDGLSLEGESATPSAETNLRLTPDKGDAVGASEQRWRIDAVGNGAYQISSVATGLALDDTSGTVQPKPAAADSGQKWLIAASGY